MKFTIPVFPRCPCPLCRYEYDDEVETPLHPSAYEYMVRRVSQREQAYEVQVAWRREQALNEELRLAAMRRQMIW